MKALIIEDEDLAAQRLIRMLKEIQPDMELFGPLDSIDATLKHLQENNQYDLLILDIQLADGKSFSIFTKIKIQTPIIFTTAYDEYAIKAFELNSIDYLLKPIKKEKLASSLEKYNTLKEYYKQNPFNEFTNLIKNLTLGKQQLYKTRFLVNGGNSLIPVMTDQIAYFFADDKVVFMVTKENKRFLINHTIEDLEEKLNPQEFYRVNRQFIVSISSIIKIHNYFNYKLKLDVTPNSNIEIIVSKARVGNFKDWMNGIH
jgi:two-component system, LytTR family, response regulator LytT